MLVNKEHMRQWIAALRSGEYPQARGTLKKVLSGGGFAYCCLGVVCELAIKDGVPVRVTRHVDDYEVFYRFDGLHALLPPQVAQWLGTDSNPGVNIAPIGAHYSDCVSTNDRLLWDFGKIADALERTYLQGDEDDTPAAD